MSELIEIAPSRWINPSLHPHETPQLPEDYHKCRGFTAPVKWSGVVSIERPDTLNNGLASADPLCRVLSARNLSFNGRRAIMTLVPYSLVRHFFQVEDEGQIYVSASLRDEHLEFHDRCDFMEWAYYSAPSN